MNISEMHVWFRQYAQQMGTQNTRAILPEQIDLVINTSIVDTVINVVNQNISSRGDKIQTDNSKIGQINALRTLYTTINIKDTSNKSLSEYKRTSFDIDIEKEIDNLMFIDSFSISYKRKLEKDTYENFDLFPIRIIDRSLLANTFQDYILSPNFKSPIVTLTNKKDDVNSEENIDSKQIASIYLGKNDLYSNIISNIYINYVECSYIKKPNKVKYVNVGDEKNIDCDLPDSLHIEILKHAVDLYRNSLIGSIATKQAQAQNQAMENLRDNIR